MAFNHQQYNRTYLNNVEVAGQPTNDATAYAVRVIETEAAEGEIYWKVIGVHHLLPEENRGNHHIYLEALDESGQRVQNPIAWADFTWEGRNPNERAGPVQLDKPPNEAAGNIAVHSGQVISVWMKGLAPDASESSDRVENLRTDHPDEPGGSGELWNSIGHHSFYVVFQRTRKAAGPAVTGEGVISGRIANGQGYTVRLLQGETIVAEQTVDQSLAFRFEGLSLGTYRLQAVAPSLYQDNLTLDAGNQEINLDLAAP